MRSPAKNALIILCAVLLGPTVASNLPILSTNQRGITKYDREKGLALQLQSKSHSEKELVEHNALESIDSKLVINEKLSGPLCILGGTLVHLTLGTLYCWGNFLSYAPQYLKFYDGQEHKGAQPDALIVIPLTILSMCVSMPLGPSLVNAVGASKTLLIGSWLMSAGVFLSSYAKSLSAFILSYAVLFGTGVGLAYTAPMVAGWKWLPLQKGLVSGIILTGFGSGGFFFNLLGTSFVNPKGFDAVNGKFPEEVYNNFPSMLRKMAVIYAAMQLLGSLLVSEPVPAPAPAALAAPAAAAAVAAAPSPLAGVTIAQAVTTSQFWVRPASRQLTDLT